MKTKKEENEKINEIESLDRYFPKENKKRGEAMVVCAESFLLGKKSSQEQTKKLKNHVHDLKESNQNKITALNIVGGIFLMNFPSIINVGSLEDVIIILGGTITLAGALDFASKSIIQIKNRITLLKNGKTK